MEHWRVGHVVIGAVCSAEANDFDWWFVFLHMADLYRRCMGPEEVFSLFSLFVRVFGEEERILHFARRVTGREIKRCEVVPIILNIRAFRNGEPHSAKDSNQLFHGLGDGVDRALSSVGGTLAAARRVCQPFSSQQHPRWACQVAGGTHHAESDATRELYGLNENTTKQFGRRCLLARRLVERGVRFVQVWAHGWDSHDDVLEGHRKAAARVDRPIAGLLADLR